VYRWARLAGRIRCRYRVSPRPRVNGYVCAMWAPFPNLGRNLFPSAEVFWDLTRCGWVLATKACVQGARGSQGSASLQFHPHGGNLTKLTEPCGALPRKCSLIRRSVPVDNHFRISLIQATRTERNSICLKQQQRMGPKSVAIHSQNMHILRSVPIENHFQMSPIQETRTHGNSICPKQQPKMEQQWIVAQTHEIMSPKSFPKSSPSRIRQLTPAPSLQNTISLTNRSRHGHPRLKARLATNRCGQVRSQQSSDARKRFSSSAFSFPFRDEGDENPEPTPRILKQHWLTDGLKRSVGACPLAWSTVVPLGSNCDLQ
jgi:hypothetical protein